MRFLRMTELPLEGKRVFIRADLNVPQDDAGVITDDTRIRASIPAIEQALAKGAAVMVTSHLGRPTEGELKAEDSLAPVAARLAQLLNRKVPLIANWVDGGFSVNPGEVVLLENCRVNKGEKKNDEALSRQMAALCDIYVNDAFGTAHRRVNQQRGVIALGGIHGGQALVFFFELGHKLFVGSIVQVQAPMGGVGDAQHLVTHTADDVLVGAKAGQHHLGVFVQTSGHKLLDEVDAHAPRQEGVNHFGLGGTNLSQFSGVIELPQFGVDLARDIAFVKSLEASQRILASLVVRCQEVSRLDLQIGGVLASRLMVGIVRPRHGKEIRRAL